MAHGFQVTFDAHDTAALAAFWSLALGYIEQRPPPGFDSREDFAVANDIPVDDRNNIVSAVDPEGSGPRLLFQKVPEGKTAKNRVHLDVNVTGPGMEIEERKHLVEALVGTLSDARATRQKPFENVHDWGSSSGSSCRTPRATSSA